jgi:predicted nucleic acid-binding protein
VIVVDSCFAVAALVDEEHSEFVRELLLALGATELIAPKLIWWEFANVIQQKVRRGLLTGDEREAIWGRFNALGITTPGDPAFSDFPELARLSDLHGLTAYDAAYVHLALVEGAGLATLDRNLARGAASEKVTVLAPFPMVAP